MTAQVSGRDKVTKEIPSQKSGLFPKRKKEKREKKEGNRRLQQYFYFNPFKFLVS